MKDNQQESQPLEEAPEVSSELSKIASNPKRNIAILAVAGIVFAYLVYQIIKGDPPPPDPAQAPVVATPTNVYKPPPASASEGSQGVPAIPDLPKLAAPSAPPPPPPQAPQSSTPPPPSAMPSAPPPTASNLASPLPSFAGDSEEAKKRAEAKKKSSVMLVGGKESIKTAAEVQQQKDFTIRGDMSYILGKGKILEAVLESAVNTDFGGEVRAVIVRDVFAEDGNLILIAKGSKVFGTYSAGQKEGSARIDITWSRIDLPSGYSLNFASDTIDSLGRKGVEGRLDNKYKEQLTNAVLTSAFNIALAGALDKIVPPPVTSSTAAQTNAQTTQINNALAAASSTPGATAGSVCTAVLPIVPTTSTAFTTISAACASATAPVPVGGTPITQAQALQTVMAAITSATANLSQTTAAASTPTQAQAASQQAFKDVTDSVKTMVGQNVFKPTVTLDQGKPVKIYVNKDYVFPKGAVSRSRIIK